MCPKHHEIKKFLAMLMFSLKSLETLVFGFLVVTYYKCVLALYNL